MAVETVKPETYKRYVALCTELKEHLTDLKADMAAGPVSGNAVLQLHERIISDRAKLASYAAVSGIADFVANAESTNAATVSANFNALLAEMDDITNYLVGINATLVANWLTFTSGGVTTKTFSSTDTTTLRTHIQAVIDEIG